MGLFDWLGDKIQESMNPDIDSQFRYLYNNYHDGLIWYMNSSYTHPHFRDLIRTPSEPLSLSLPFYVKKRLVENKDTIISLCEWERDYRTSKPLIDNNMYGVCYVVKKYLKDIITTESIGLFSEVHSIIDDMLGVEIYDKYHRKVNKDYRELPFEYVSTNQYEVIAKHKDEVLSIDNKIKYTFHNRDSKQKILNDELRSKYYQSFLNSKDKDELDFAYCLDNQKEFDRYIFDVLFEQYKDLSIKYKFALTAFRKLEDLDDLAVDDLYKIIKSEESIAKLREKSDKELRDLIEKKRNHDNYLYLVRVQNENAAYEKRLRDQRDSEIVSLKSCISSWNYNENYGFKYFFMYHYFPTSVEVVAQKDWNVRNLIWTFKDDPTKDVRFTPSSAGILVRLDTEKVINHFFGNKKTRLTFVCVPASTKQATETRYKKFSQDICNSLGMRNGYDYVQVYKDKTPRHLGGRDEQILSVDNDFFKDSFVILFDDIMTSGKSLARMKQLLENSGAAVIGCITIGMTKHHNTYIKQPIDMI